MLDATRSVLVLPETLLYTDTTQYLLAQFPVDLSKQDTAFNAGLYQSLIIGFDGDVLEQKKDRIAYRSIFFEHTEKSKSDEERYNLSYFTRAQDYSEEELTLTNPISGLSITPSMFRGGAVTDANGRYAMSVRGVPCPGFSYSMPLYLEARIPFRPFNPNQSGSYFYYLSRLNYFSCQGWGPQSFIMLNAADFPIDVNMLSGRFNFPDVTLASEQDEIKLEYDFN
ncbi:MAG: hypothetical protein P8X89_22400, partial [Reinekea sp.]